MPDLTRNQNSSGFLLYNQIMPLDIGVGILLSIFMSRLFHIPLSPIFISTGILFTLLPDLDFLVAFKKNLGAKSHEHRDVLHYPLLFVPIGTALMFLVDYRLSILFAFASFLHFLHDSIGVGWGIQWLYPFSRNHYAFLYQYDSPQKFIYIWTPEEVVQLSSQFGDPHWIKNIYFKLHPYAIIEFAAFAFSIIMLILYR
jgi:membrane-bound metal-dependent hydrolase YbcI (DUF457 family)